MPIFRNVVYIVIEFEQKKKNNVSVSSNTSVAINSKAKFKRLNLKLIITLLRCVKWHINLYYTDYKNPNHLFYKCMCCCGFFFLGLFFFYQICRKKKTWQKKPIITMAGTSLIFLQALCFVCALILCDKRVCVCVFPPSPDC